MFGFHRQLAGIGLALGAVVVIGLTTPAWAQVSTRTVSESAKGKAGGVYVCPPCSVDCHDKTYAEPGKCEHPDCGMDLHDRTAVRYVAIFIWQGAEILDFAGPAEVFASARKDGERPFEVYTVGLTEDPVWSQGFIQITPEFSIENCPQPDIFVLPGGGTNRVATNPDMLDWVRRTFEHSEIAMSVCTGAFVLASAGLLDDLEATTYHSAVERLRGIAPSAIVHDDQRWVDNGNVVTAAGVSAGIDASLHVVARLCGEDVARATADYMEYDWRPEEVTGRMTSSGASKRLTPIQEFLRLLVEDGVNAAMEAREEILNKPDAIGLPSENQVNSLGYRYLTGADLDVAIEILKYNVRVNPDSFNVYDSLGEAYMAAGERDLAIKNYSKSLELNPENENGVAMLEKLGKN